MPKYSSTMLAQTSDPLEIQKALLDLLKKINEVAEEASGVAASGGIPTGTVLEYAGSEPPDGGFLLCDGHEVSRVVEARLFAKIGTTWGAGDGINTFNVPDLREASPYGVGTRDTGVTTHDTLALGEFRDDQMQAHWHKVGGRNDRSLGGGSANRVPMGDSQTATFTNVTRDAITDGAHGTPRTGATTHGKIVGMNYIIKN